MDIIEKKYGKSPEDVVADAKQQKKAQSNYNIQMAEVDQALTEFLNILDPIKWNGKTIMCARRPSMKELKKMIPKEMAKYADHPEDIPQSIQEKYEGFFYQKMSEIIVAPKHTAEEWEELANPWLMNLFWKHISSISEQIQGKIEGF